MRSGAINKKVKIKQERERRIFRHFAENNQFLPLDVSTIQSRLDPEPDILCKDIAGNLIAFELVEVVDEGMVKRDTESVRLGEIHTQALRGMANLSDAFILIVFQLGKFFKTKGNSALNVKNLLQFVPASYEGEIILLPALKQVIRHLSIAGRTANGGPFVSVGTGGGIGDPLREVIEKKFEKNYTTPTQLNCFAIMNSNLQATISLGHCR